MVKFRWPKYVYVVAILLFVITSLTVPYVKTEEVTKRIFFLYPLLQLVVQLAFLGKFDGDLEMTSVQTFVIYIVVTHFVPFGYYFMLRRVYSPSILYIVMILTSHAIEISMLWLYDKGFSLKWRKVENE